MYIFFLLPLTHGAQGIEPCEVWDPQHVWAWRWRFGLWRKTHFYINLSIQSSHLWVWVFVQDSQTTPRSLILQFPQGYRVSRIIAWQTYMNWDHGHSPFSRTCDLLFTNSSGADTLSRKPLQLLDIQQPPQRSPPLLSNSSFNFGKCISRRPRSCPIVYQLT